jgi:hypothetical protein
MIFFIDKPKEGKSVLVRARAEDGLMVGDLVNQIHEGETFGGYTFDQLVTMGPGPHTLHDTSQPGGL